MVDCETIEAQFRALDDIQHVQATGDGYHYHLIVVSERFTGQSLVIRQQWVYAQLKSYITSGELHALTMQTLTVSEWEKKKNG